MAEWIEETLHPHFRTRFEASRVLLRRRTEHQELILIENPTFGRVLFLDGALQTTEADEFIYHEMLTHLPLLAHGAVRRVLIIGGGDGGMLEEVLKHRSVESVTLVEIDSGVIELSRAHLSAICGEAFDDPRLDLVIADGVEFVETTGDRFDLVIVDSTDPIGPGEVLFGERFYAGCRRVLAPGGVLVTQNGVPFLQPDELGNSIAILRGLFREATCYLATVPSYVGGPMAFGWASDDPVPRRTAPEVLAQRFAEAGIRTRYYRPELHAGAFALPGYVADLVA